MTVLVVGAGLEGLATARALLDRDIPVIVADVREGVALETSFANAGMLTPSLPEPWNGPGAGGDLVRSLFRANTSLRFRPTCLPSYFSWGIRFLRHSNRASYEYSTVCNYELARYSLDRTLALSREKQFEFDLSRNGTLCIFDTSEELETRWQLCEQLMERGLRAERLSPGQVAHFQPSLENAARRIAGGIRLPDDARGDAHRFCRALAATILEDGGEIRTATEVKGLAVEAGRVTGLDTAGGRMDGSRVVVAAGVWSPLLMRRVGIPVPVKPAKGFSLTWGDIDRSRAPDVALLDESAHAVISTFGDRLRIVGMAEFCGFDQSIPQSRVDYLVGVLRKLLPHLSESLDVARAAAWAGLRPMSADGRPLIGPIGMDGLYVNTGHGALGWTLAMGSGHLLADLITGRKPATDPGPFLPDSR